VKDDRASGAPGDLHDLAEGRGVAHGEVGQDLAVEAHLCLAEPGDQRSVRDAALPGGGVDSDDPELAELSLALLAVTRRIGQRVEQGLARGLDQLGPRAAAAFGRIQQSLVAPVGGDASLDSSDGCRALLEVGQQASDLRNVVFPDDRLGGVAARASGGLDLEVVAAPRIDPENLAGAGHPESLLSRFVALHLGHCRFTLLSMPRVAARLAVPPPAALFAILIG